MKLHRSVLARRIFLKAFSKINPGDVTIKHHYTQDPFCLHSYRHRGYWFHGANRERETMQMFSKIIVPGMDLIEIGAHIGYLSLLFKDLVGENGKIYAFEPGPNNLVYLRRNLQAFERIELLEQAVSDQDGEATFYVENLSGQNCSLNSEYEIFQKNRESAFSKEEYESTTVQTLTLDTFTQERNIRPDFIKIDVESVELAVLLGASQTLHDCRPLMMVEVTKNEEEVISLLKDAGYRLLLPNGTDLGGKIKGNIVFAFHRDEHEDQFEACREP